MYDDDAFRFDDAQGVSDDDHCEIFSTNNSFPQIIQGVLALMALGSLWWKRKNERPKRHIKTWTLDVLKQGGGAVYAHFLNIFVSVLLSKDSKGENSLVDECAWYAIAFLVDTTFGLVLSVIFLKVLIWLAHKFDWPRLKDSGIYFVDETDRSETGCLCLPFLHKLHCIRNCWFKKTWRCQFYAWLLILTLVKVILALFMYMFSASLAIIGGWMFSPFQASPKIELVFVMIVFPGFLNVLYFWIIDNYLKNNANNNEINSNFESYRPMSGDLNVGLSSNTVGDSLIPPGAISSSSPSSSSDVQRASLTHNVNDENENALSFEMKEPSWLSSGSKKNSALTKIAGESVVEI